MESSPALQLPPSRPKRLRWQIYFATLLACGVLVYFFQPALATWWLQRTLTRQAGKNEASLAFGKLEADFFTGNVLMQEVRLDDQRTPGNSFQAGEIQVEFSLWRLIFQRDKTPITKLVVNKTEVDWKWRTNPANPNDKGRQRAAKIVGNWFPETFIGNDISARLECGLGKMSLSNADFTFQPNTAGEIDIPQMTASLPPWQRTFTNLEGVTAIKERALYIGGIRFSPDLTLERGALDFTQPDKQKITSDLLFTAFGGQIRTDIDLARRKWPVEVDAAASFWNLSVKQLGDFVGNHKWAEGLIHEGRITFHGNPAEPAKSNTTMRLNATDFRWHERRWDSLIASALLMNRRIEIPRFDLVQEKNQIQLKGSAELPSKWSVPPAEFQLQVLAQIDDLHSAALLVLPGRQGIAGEAFFAGEIRNQNGQFSGNLKMRGGPLQISGVKVDRVRGDLDLQGSEIKATALEFARRDDQASGWATLNLAEPRQYSGEFEVQAKNINDYAAILPRAIAERAAAGGVELWWSGDGTNQAHSGAFKVHLREFLISHSKNAVPLDVETHGSYSPAGITLNNLGLRRPNTRLNSAVVVRRESLELRNLFISGAGGSSITGNITLPINLLAALDNPNLAALLDSKASATGQITGKKVRLDEFAELLGHRQIIRGRTDFALTASGPLESLVTHLDITMEDLFIPQLLSIATLQTTFHLADNQISFQSQINSAEPRDAFSLQVSARTILSQANLIQGKWLNDSAPLSGSFQAKRFAIPRLHPWFPDLRPWQGDATTSLKLAGTRKNPAFDGTITLQNVEYQPPWLPYPLQKLSGNLLLAPTRLNFEKLSGQYRSGQFSISGSTGYQPAEDLDLQITGKSLVVSAPDDPSEAVLDGSLRLQGPEGTRTLRGAVQIQNGVLHRELTISSPAVELPAVSQFSLPWVPPSWKVNLEVTASQPLEIRGRNATWLVQPELVFRDTALTPLLMGKLTIRPTPLASASPDTPSEVVAYFAENHLENGVVEDPRTALLTDLPPAPSLENAPPSSPESPTPPPPVSRRLDIAPLAPLPKAE